MADLLFPDEEGLFEILSLHQWKSLAEIFIELKEKNARTPWVTKTHILLTHGVSDDLIEECARYRITSPTFLERGIPEPEYRLTAKGIKQRRALDAQTKNLSSVPIAIPQPAQQALF